MNEIAIFHRRNVLQCDVDGLVGNEADEATFIKLLPRGVRKCRLQCKYVGRLCILQPRPQEISYSSTLIQITVLGHTDV